MWPYIGTYSNSTICCLYCDNGALKIKSPYCHQGEAKNSVEASNKKLCLKETNGKLHLDTDQMYYRTVGKFGRGKFGELTRFEHFEKESLMK